MKNKKLLIQGISEQLKSEQQAWWLLEFVTNKTKAQLIAEDIQLTELQQQQLDKAIHRIVNEHYPIQYIIGRVPFLDCEILVESPILIPRPETEEWCANLISQLKSLENKKIHILDMCTGSGCIAIAIAKALPDAQIVAVDISDKAISLAQKNIELNCVKNVEVIKSDLFSSLDTLRTRDERKTEKTNPFVSFDTRCCATQDARAFNNPNSNGFGKNHELKFDLIVSNPPYIDEQLFDTLDLSVKNWEDPNALISKEGGLYIIKKIIKEAPNYLKLNSELVSLNMPNLVLEIDETQGEQVAELMQNAGFKNVQIKKDLYGKDRVVCGRL